MKYVFFLLALITFNSFGSNNIRIASYYVVSNEVDSNLGSNQSQFTFNIREYDAKQSKSILYSVNEVEKTANTKKLTAIEENVNSGSYNFKFVLSLEYHEIFINEIVVEPQHHIIIQLNFSRSDENIRMKKPVIYLYPQEETEVNIKLTTTGELTFTYPEYKNGWSVTADSLGTITSNDETFNYLFWEGEQPDHLSTANLKEGFIVEGQNVVSFLEDKLTIAGLTSKEQADFITFWGPSIQKNELNFVRFEFNETCDKFAKLKINPVPHQIYRIYIFFSPIDAPFDVKEQEIESIDRTGFTVLEWGGQTSNQIQIIPTTI